MSDYLYHPNSKEIYHQSLKALTCVHTRVVRGLIEKRSLETEAWLSRHIESCNQCRIELQTAMDEEKLLNSLIPFVQIDARFEAEIEEKVGREMQSILSTQNRGVYYFKLLSASVRELSKERIFWLGLLFVALVVIKLTSIDL